MPPSLVNFITRRELGVLAFNTLNTLFDQANVTTTNCASYFNKNGTTIRYR
jgi:hypothetical protein